MSETFQAQQVVVLQLHLLGKLGKRVDNMENRISFFSNGYFFRKEGSNYLFFNPSTYQSYLINEIGFKILSLLKKGTHPSEISKKYGIPNKNLSEFIKSVHKVGLITGRNYESVEAFQNVQKIEQIELDLQAPIRISWLITDRCNLRCKHCYLSSSSIPRIPELPTQEVKKIIDKIAESGVFIIYFTGGEPFIRNDFMEILKYTSDSGMNIGISTNGTLLTSKMISKMTHFRITRIQVSLDGATKNTHEFIRGPNTFEKVIHNIKELVNYGFNVGITTVIHRKNLHELKDIMLLASKLGVKGLKISPLMPWGRAKENH